MLLFDWSNAVAHVDADRFFAACEIVRRPGLRAAGLRDVQSGRLHRCQDL